MLCNNNRRGFPGRIITYMGTMKSDVSYPRPHRLEEDNMDGIIYLIGLIVIVMAILSFFGLR